MEKEDIKINLLGDVCLTKMNRPIVATQEPEKLFNGLHKILVNSDFNIANFEAPIPEESHLPIKKIGPALRNDKNLVEILKKSNFQALGLANNHILDYGQAAVVSTINNLNDENIESFGAGLNKIEAKKPLFIEVGNRTIGLMAYAEHEFNLAGENSAGANWFDSSESYDDIKLAKGKCDYLIVLFHGGVEYHAYPSPLLQQKCRKMVDVGADLVSCQHSHCIGSMENYNAGTVVYGQGNAVFGYKKNQNTWNEGLVVQLVFSGDDVKVKYVPVKALPLGGIDLMSEVESKKCLKEFDKRSEKCSDIQFLEGQWLRFCNSKKSMYLGHLFGLNRYFMFLNRKLNNKIIDTLFSKRQKMIAHNLIRCESHNEVLQTIFKNEEQ